MTIDLFLPGKGVTFKVPKNQVREKMSTAISLGKFFYVGSGVPTLHTKPRNTAGTTQGTTTKNSQTTFKAVESQTTSVSNHSYRMSTSTHTYVGNGVPTLHSKPRTSPGTTQGTNVKQSQPTFKSVES